MRIAIYCRVSTDEQNVQQQVDYLRDYCKQKDWKVVRICPDKESGRLPLVHRKKFMRLLDDIQFDQDDRFQAVLVYNLDRLTRNWDDVTFIEKFFRENWNKCKLLSMRDSIDLSNASGRMMFRVKMAVNCYMPEDMREKQIIGIERAKREGKYKYGNGRPKNKYADNVKAFETIKKLEGGLIHPNK